MQRRLNLACALVGDVKLLLLDEPTVGADENSTEIILNTITALKTAAARCCSFRTVRRILHVSATGQ